MTPEKVMAEGLSHLRDKIEGAITQSERNCLWAAKWRAQHSALSTCDFKKVIAAEILQRFVDEVFRGPSATAAYDEFVDCCRGNGCDPFSRSVFEETLRQYFRELATERGANDVLRLAA